MSNILKPPTFLDTFLTIVPRIASAAILLCVGGFMLAYFLGGEETSSRDLMFRDYAGLAALGTSLAGLALAWKWERLGACLTLVSVAVGAALNWNFVLSPLVVIPIAAVLFLFCEWLKQSTKPAW